VSSPSNFSQQPKRGFATIFLIPSKRAINFFQILVQEKKKKKKKKKKKNPIQLESDNRQNEAQISKIQMGAV
jgi:ribosomal protein L9